MITSFKESYVFRQLAAIAASGWLSLTAGFAYGFSAVLLPDLKEDENFPYNDNLGSWIASITPLSMIVCCLCAGSIIDRFGRKVGHIILSMLSVISWVIIAFATNVTLLLIGRFVAGFSVGSNRPVTLVYLGEITSPKYRCYSLLCPSFSLSLGILLCHVIGGYISWRKSSYIYIVVNLLCLISLFFLKETPLWLISKGNIDEGIKSFIGFRGKGIEAESELKLVLQRQNEKTDKYLMKDIFSLAFIKPFCTAILLAVVTQFNGINSITFYAKEILGNTVKGEIDPFLLMIMYDIIRLLTFILIFLCNKFIPRKILFIGVNICCCISLFSLVAFLSLMNVSEYVWLAVTLIILYTVFGSSIVVLAWTFIPELFSGNLRGLGSGLSASISFLLLFVCVKISPGFMANYGEIYMYACFGLITAVTTIILCFLLPETNGRTLQDIEDTYKKNTTI
ncbi:facilitated trehalose transporter Tret1-like [Nymphalis io]|uniref:facilitated trehalose transporter Tret1-like n=1 Tax=Inachis io TaxID=171585 RepID=UPI002168F74D|nr:facilitated trehalose transporter Tret1-like [Nymphalis io]